MEALTKVVVVFTLALALALLIERLLEVIKSLYDLLDSRFDWYRFWNRRTEKLRQRLEKRLKIFEYVEPKSAAAVLYRVREMLLNKTDEQMSNTPILSGDMVRTIYTKTIFKLIGITVGIVLAFCFKIDLLKIWQQAAADSSSWTINIKNPSVRICFTGIAMGLGSGPVHKIISKIESKRKKREEKEV